MAQDEIGVMDLRREVLKGDEGRGLEVHGDRGYDRVGLMSLPLGPEVRGIEHGARWQSSFAIRYWRLL